MILEIEGKKFDVDIEKTKEYYSQHSLCDCVGCRNFYKQISQKYLHLNEFLQQFGVDMSKPNELGWDDLSNGTLDYHFAAYTVCGSILEHDKYEIDIQDNTFISIVADNNNAPPNEQKSDNYFVLMVYGIQLPYIINEPLVIETKPKKKLFDFFQKLRLDMLFLIGIFFAEQCVSLTCNERCTSCVMYASQVMCPAGRERNTSHHFGDSRYITMPQGTISLIAVGNLHHFFSAFGVICPYAVGREKAKTLYKL